MWRPVRRCVPSFGAGRALPHRGFSGRFGAVFEGRKEEQEKALTPFCVRAATTARSAGGSENWDRRFFREPNVGLTLIWKDWP